MTDRFQAEQEASRSLMELFEQAKKCQILHERAHMALPEPLRRFLGMSGVAGKFANASHISPPDTPPMPPDADADWIWIDEKNASATSIALAILRDAKAPMKAGEVIKRVNEVLPEVPRGTIFNIGTRLGGDEIKRTEVGWQLVKAESAPVLYKNRVWGPPEIFSKQELASHRRDGILHILAHFQTGLQTVQILGELKKCSWVQAPINKDLVKEDMEFLQSKGLVRKRGNSKKWEIVVPQEKHGE